MSDVGTQRLAEMPEPYRLRLLTRDGEVSVFRGPYLYAQYSSDDLGMRNLAIVALSDAGVSVNEVASCFQLGPSYVSSLRTRARQLGSEGLVRPRGRQRSLSPRQLARAAQLSRKGITNREIAKRFGVHPGTIARRLEALQGARPESEQLSLEHETGPVGPEQGGDEATEHEAEPPRADEEPSPEPVQRAAARGQMKPAPVEQERCSALVPASSVELVATRAGELVPTSAKGIARITEGEVHSRYAGAMLLHPFLSRVGLDELISGLSFGPARRYDPLALVSIAVLGFALHIDSLEGAKHLRCADAGALLGLPAFPSLRSLRPGLKAIGEASDPLLVQRSIATAMLALDHSPPELFYVDDHFVTYWGSRPLAKGWNNRRHIAEKGRDDTFVVDDTWRAICFSSGEPRGLSVSMPAVLDELARIVSGAKGSGAKVMVGFDRGGSYPKVFSELARRGMDWVTWRRAPLVAPTAEPKALSYEHNGKTRELQLLDEEVTLAGYDATPVRQVSAFEEGKVVFQLLSSASAPLPALLVGKLKGRWVIENFNKYVEDHHGVHWLCSYDMDEEEDTSMVSNPERVARRKTLSEAKAALEAAQRAVGLALDAGDGSMDESAKAIRAARDEVVTAKDELAAAKAALKGVPAKLARNELDQDAKRAKPRLGARALQMVCRLLAYNAELDLSRRLNAYLDDEDEYRAITRNLLHLGGRIDYRHRFIEVTLEQPDSPRIARALGQVIAEINAGPPVHPPGDRRPISYRIAGS